MVKMKVRLNFRIKQRINKNLEKGNGGVIK